MNALITLVILIAVIAWCARAERRRLEREATRDAAAAAQFDRDYAAGIAAGGRDKLDALIEATRERPHESYAWGPHLERIATDDDQPTVLLPAEQADLDAWERELAEGIDR